MKAKNKLKTSIHPLVVWLLCLCVYICCWVCLRIYQMWMFY